MDDCRFEVKLEGSGSLAVCMSGAWVKENAIPGTGVIIGAVEKNNIINRIYFDSSGIPVRPKV